MKHLIGIPILLIISTIYGMQNNASHITQTSSPRQIDSLMVLRYQDSLLESFYRQNEFRTFWTSTEARLAATLAIADAYSEGLDPQDYALSQLRQSENQVGTMSNEARDAYDILLTQSLQKYISHIANGKLDPNQLYDDWILPRTIVDVNAFIRETPPAEICHNIDRLKPQHPCYKSLKKALILIDELPRVNTIDSIRIMRKIELNDTRDVVPLINKRLLEWKDITQIDSTKLKYDVATVAAVKKFQRRHGLKQDGIIGPATADALNISVDSRRKSIIANMERWRWYPRDLGTHYIIVNIPAFKLTVVKDNDTIEKKKVIVGTIDRRTPVLTSTFSNITFNPTWTVPPTILREDIVPSAIKDRGYFYEKKITIYDYKNNVVSPWHWNPEKATTYRYVQSPGTHNALGTVKFNFPNNRMVYLHDTNTRSLFSQNYRSLSSGCVRVDDPMPLAEYLLNDPNWTLSKLEDIIRSRKTTTIKIRDKVQLHQFYWTAWTDPDGTLIFREDIYKLDEALYAKLRS